MSSICTPVKNRKKSDFAEAIKKHLREAGRFTRTPQDKVLVYECGKTRSASVTDLTKSRNCKPKIYMVGVNTDSVEYCGRFDLSSSTVKASGMKRHEPSKPKSKSKKK